MDSDMGHLPAAKHAHQFVRISQNWLTNGWNESVCLPPRRRYMATVSERVGS